MGNARRRTKRKTGNEERFPVSGDLTSYVSHFTNMRALMFDPYLDTGGGGERYALTVASLLIKKGWQVDICWPDFKIGNWLKERLGIDLSKVTFVDNTLRGAAYDLVFWLSDGSIPLLFGKKNIIHFQTPFQNVGGKSVLNKIKLSRISSIICNSEFTKSFIDREYGVKSIVVYPPVNTKLFRPGKKENIILFVGRFSQLQQQKRQDILIENFAKMYKADLKNWRLVLVGGSEVGGREYAKELREKAVLLPVDILENLPLGEVRKYYAKAKIFWSAVGYGVDESKLPHQVEHFGMSVVEAQAAGCVPVVISKGGHKEIVVDGENGLLWETTDMLREITLQLVKDERRMREIAKKAEESSKRFSVARFGKNFGKILG